MLKLFARVLPGLLGITLTKFIRTLPRATTIIGYEPFKMYYTKDSIRFYASDAIKNAVSHDTKANLFYVDIPGKGRAFLEYERHNRLIRILHTEVPVQLEGRGLGKILAKAALDYVSKNDLRAEIQCDFVRSYVKKYDPGFIKYLEH